MTLILKLYYALLGEIISQILVHYCHMLYLNSQVHSRHMYEDITTN
jgi:hypothetical protein